LQKPTRKAFEKKGAVLFIQRDRAAFVAANHDMLEQDWTIETGRARHEGRLSNKGDRQLNNHAPKRKQIKKLFDKSVLI
jgi:hypothetical protein